MSRPTDRAGNLRPRSGCRDGPGSIRGQRGSQCRRRVCPAACPPWIVSFLVVGLAAASSPEGLWSRPARAKVETWRQEGPAGVRQMPPRERGDLRQRAGAARALGLRRSGRSHAARVWDLARTSDGSLLRGHRRYRQGLPPRCQGRRAVDRASTTRPTPRCFRWSIGPDGTVFAGTGPERPGRQPDRSRSIRPLASTRRSSTSGTWPPTRRATCTPPPGPPASSGSARPTADGRSSMTARQPTCSAWRSGRMGASTPAATARG